MRQSHLQTPHSRGLEEFFKKVVVGEDNLLRHFIYSLSLFNHFCPVKRNGKYFANKWSEQKGLELEVVGLYSTYQKYKRIGVPSSYQFGENWT